MYAGCHPDEIDQLELSIAFSDIAIADILQLSSISYDREVQIEKIEFQVRAGENTPFSTRRRDVSFLPSPLQI